MHISCVEREVTTSTVGGPPRRRVYLDIDIHLREILMQEEEELLAGPLS